MAQNLRISLDYSITDLTFLVYDGDEEVVQRKYSVNSLLVPQKKEEQPAEDNGEEKKTEE